MQYKLDKKYEEKVYAGVLGKIIGVFLGRPFEGWSYERIMKELGPINYYVNDKLDFPLPVSDDDITGTFTLSYISFNPFLGLSSSISIKSYLSKFGTL